MSAALGLISDLGAPIADLVLYALILALGATLVASALWFGYLRPRARSGHFVHSVFAFGLVSSLVLGAVFGLNRFASSGPGTGFLASHIEGLRLLQDSLVRVESKVDKLRDEQAKESKLADLRAAKQAAELEAIRLSQQESERHAKAERLEKGSRDMESKLRAEQQAAALEHLAMERVKVEEERKSEAGRQHAALREEQERIERLRARAEKEQKDRDAAQQAVLDQLMLRQQQLLVEFKQLRGRDDEPSRAKLVGIESELSVGDASIQRQLQLPSNEQRGLRVDYLRAREAAAAGETHLAGECWLRYLASCEDEYDPLAEYAEFAKSSGADPRPVLQKIAVERGIQCAALLAAVLAPMESRLVELQALRDQRPSFAVASLFLGRELLANAQRSGAGKQYAQAAQELRRASAGIRAREFDRHVLDRRQIQSWLEEIERILPLVESWEASQVVAAGPPGVDDCHYSVLASMRARDVVSEVGECEGASFVLYRVVQTPAEALQEHATAKAVEEGKRALATWLESRVSAEQKREISTSRTSGGEKSSLSSFYSRTVSSSDVTQSGIQLYASQPTADGGMEYAFLLSSKAEKVVKDLRNAIRAPSPEGLVCVEARAMVSMKGKDEATAREEAIASARLDAMGQVVGFRQRTIFAQRESEMKQQTSLSLNKGYIKSMSIELDVRRGEVYVVEIEACIAMAEVDKRIGDAMKSMGRPKVQVIGPVGELKTHLEGELGKSEVPLTQDQGKADFIVTINASYDEYVRKLGGSERPATRLNATLEMVDRHTRESNCQMALSEVRSFVAGDEQRRRDCQRQLLSAATAESGGDGSDETAPLVRVEEFLSCVRDSFRKLADEGRPVIVEIEHGGFAREMVQVLMRGLHHLPGVTAVEEESYEDGRAQMHLRFLGGSQWLVDILERDFSEIAGESGLGLRRREVTGRFVRLSVAR